MESRIPDDAIDRISREKQIVPCISFDQSSM